MSKPVRLLVRYGNYKGELPARRREPSLFALIPWRVFLVLGASAYAFMRWGSPCIVPKSTFSAGIVSGFQAGAIFAWECGVIFAVIAALVALIQGRFQSTRP